jgi:hypothetical protein
MTRINGNLGRKVVIDCILVVRTTLNAAVGVHTVADGHSL